MNNKDNFKDVDKEFEVNFSYIAHKGIQCDEITINKIKTFIHKKLQEERERASDELNKITKLADKYAEVIAMVYDGKEVGDAEEIVGLREFTNDEETPEIPQFKGTNEALNKLTIKKI